MKEIEILNKKRDEVLREIKPIMEAFNIKDYDYMVKDTGQRETLKIEDVYIGCSCNSIFAIKQEILGYLFFSFWNERGMTTQMSKFIKTYWLDVRNKGAGRNERYKI